MKSGKPEYLAQAQQLSEDERERLLSRMAGKLPRKLERDKLTMIEAMAIQLELEDEQLQEWRARMHAIKDKESKHGNKSGADEKLAKTSAPKSAPKVETAAKSKGAKGAAVTTAEKPAKVPAKPVKTPAKPATKAAKPKTSA